MRISPVGQNNVSHKGSLDIKTTELLKDMSGKWLESAANRKTLPIINTCLFASEQINNIHINLCTMMERFGHGCKLMFAESEKSGKIRFYIENKFSNYKLIFKDIIFSKEKNKLDDITKLENLENSLAKVDPYKENSNFILQRKSSAKDIRFDSEFEPDKDYIFIENNLVGKDHRIQATMKDIEEFLSAAKEEGLI